MLDLFGNHIVGFPMRRLKYREIYLLLHTLPNNGRLYSLLSTYSMSSTAVIMEN